MVLETRGLSFRIGLDDLHVHEHHCGRARGEAAREDPGETSLLASTKTSLARD